MRPDRSLHLDPLAQGIGRASLRRAVPGLVLCAFGAVMLVLAQGQPAWVGGNVGPGLMAQILGYGVIVLGAAWALISAFDERKGTAPATCGHGLSTAGYRYSGPVLLGAVLAFAMALPVAGLVLSAGLASALAAWGAGERKLRAMAATVVGLMTLVAVIGSVLLPPTAPLWPAG
jgi:hypothetical protein